MHGPHLQLGIDIQTGESVYLSVRERLDHVAVFGATDSGKTSAAIHWCRQDAINHVYGGRGSLVIDRPGTMIDKLVGWMAASDIAAPTLVMDASQERWVVPYTPLIQRAGKDPQTVAREVLQGLVHSRGRHDANDAPMFEDTAATVFETLLETGFTLAEAMDLVHPDDNVVRDAAVALLKNHRLARWWAEFNGKTRAKRVVDTASTRRRLAMLCGSPTLRMTMGQTASVDLRRAMDDGTIVLLSLSTAGAGGSADTTVLATMLLSDLWNRAGERPEGSRPFFVTVDEASTLVTPSLALALPQSRKHGVGFTLLTQAPAQFRRRDPKLFDEVMLNTRTKVCFKLDHAGASAVAADLGVSEKYLMNLEQRHAVVRLPNCPRPRFIRIPDLTPLRADDEHRHRWLATQMARFGTLVLTGNQARENLRQRIEKPAEAIKAEDEKREPSSFKRVVRARKNAPSSMSV